MGFRFRIAALPKPFDNLHPRESQLPVRRAGRGPKCALAAWKAQHSVEQTHQATGADHFPGSASAGFQVLAFVVPLGKDPDVGKPEADIR